MFLPRKETTFGIILLVSLTLAHSGRKNEVTVMDVAFKDEILKLQMTRSIFSKSGPIESKVTFYLFTRKNNNNGQELKIDDRSLRESNFNPRKPTKFIIHGFLEDSDSKMSQRIKDNLLKAEDVNIILVDWGKLSKGINYFSTAKKTQNVGEYLAQLMDFLVKHGSNRKTFHLIGHSLGAHVAGYAGASTKTGRPGRITGLDPAKPKFHKATPDKRLDPSDADFVDCIHTCGGLLGLMEPIGHADFYPNGGTNVQPGCTILDVGKCSHSRAHHIFAESILPGHTFLTQACPTVERLNVDCRITNVKMGYYTDVRARGIFYAITKNTSPYAMTATK